MKILAGLGLAAFTFSMATAAYGQQVPGITVNGVANLSAQADSLAFTLRIATRNSQTKITDQMLAPIDDALRRAGVDPGILSTTQIFTNVPMNITILRGTMENPTPEKLQSGSTLLVKAFMATPDLMLQDGSVVASRKDCQALRYRAEAAALRDAHERALRLAAMSGVTLGRLVALTSNAGYGGPNPATCSTGYSLNEMISNPALSGLDRSISVNVFSSANATYSIR